MLRKIKIITSVVFVLWLSGCAQTSVRHHQDFEQVAKTVDSVVIIPADVQIELINFDGDNEILDDKADTIRDQIHSLASSRMQQENLNVVEFDFAAEIESNDDFAYAITTAKEAWTKSKEDMYKLGLVPEKDKAQFQTSLGSVLNTIADRTGADAALLVYYNGFEKSSGMVAKDVASSILVGVLTMGAVVPVQATEGSFIDVALVDTITGKVIWANRKIGPSVDIGALEVAFNELPDLTWKSEIVNEPVTAQEADAVVTETTSESPDAQ
ncbi:hypothetical protein [Thalassotalea sp. Y01]|uniref:hypothetical protein n=1 Tax=Thalassotalea sp. Y01 TaxID=2729613 RepID=UPI00145E0E28|nr:hypothetical protein [Thalassotalea sp. Y01]NMP17074.1 hypothetical protein [Thalassotalea sp. Y01]